MKNRNVLLTVALFFGMISALAAQNIPSYVPTNGLVGWWPFNGNANDESGNSYNGATNGATLTNDRFGLPNSSYNFNGTSDYITIPPAVNNTITGPYSISFWIKNNDGLNVINGHEVIGDRDASSYNYRFRMNFGIAQAPFLQDTSYIEAVVANQQYTILSSTPAVNNWEHYVISYSSINQVLSAYKNGALINSINNVPFEPNVRQINVGRSVSPAFPNGVAYYNGTIDDIGYWSRALSQQEITNLYNGNICYQTITVTDTLLIHTGITSYNPVAFQNTLKVWPNPGNQDITIDAGNLASMQGWKYKVTNTLGQTVVNETLINQQQTTIDLTTWGGNGIYYLHLINPQGHAIEIKKIVLAP